MKVIFFIFSLWASILNAADLIIFSFDRPLQLYAFLESVKKNIDGIDNTYVIFRTSNEKYLQGYEIVKNDFYDFNFIKQNDIYYARDFRKILMGILGKNINESKYVIFAVDDIIVQENINLREAEKFLETQDAYGFFMRLGKNIDFTYMLNLWTGIPSDLKLLNNKIYCWKIRNKSDDWNYPNSLDMTLYRKKDVLNDFKKIKFHNPNSLEGNWSCISKVGKTCLCYEKSKIVNIPLNLVNISTNRNMNSYSPKQLLDIFFEGKKLDLIPIEKLKVNSPHIEYEPTFIDR